MKRSSLLKSGLLLAGTGAVVLLSGCVVRERGYRYAPPPPPTVVYQAPPVVYQPPPPGQVSAEIEVSGAPPPPQREEILVSPGPDYVWIPGVWVWEGRWVWHTGHHARRPRPGVRWYGSHYEFRGGRHIYIEGGWR